MPALATITSLKVSLPPRYKLPTFFPSEQAEQSATEALPPRVLAEDSASYPVRVAAVPRGVTVNRREPWAGSAWVILFW